MNLSLVLIPVSTFVSFLPFGVYLIRHISMLRKLLSLASTVRLSNLLQNKIRYYSFDITLTSKVALFLVKTKNSQFEFPKAVLTFDTKYMLSSTRFVISLLKDCGGDGPIYTVTKRHRHCSFCLV